MQAFTYKTGRQERLIYLIVWALLFMAPVMSMYVHSRIDHTWPFRWHDVFTVWEALAAFFLVFLIHNCLLAPLLVYRHKNKEYLAWLVVLVAAFTAYQCTHRPSDMPPPPRGGMPAMRTDEPALRQPGAQRHPDRHPPVDRHDIVAFTILLLTLGANLGVKQYFKSATDRMKYEELERVRLEQELEYLKYQINPHFFMNTLNNIHALVDIDPEKAKNSVVELSKLMRYVLYEGVKDRIPLSSGVTFLNHYISLMRMRYTDKVRIDVDVPAVIPHAQIPPLLMVPFVENAFKHGVSYQKESFIEVTITTRGNRLLFTCRNSKNSNGQHHGGVGLANVQKRLQLLYGDRYTLVTRDGDTTYDMSLEIPLDI